VIYLKGFAHPVSLFVPKQTLGHSLNFYRGFASFWTGSGVICAEMLC
jgi:hypothetical protein